MISLGVSGVPRYATAWASKPAARRKRSVAKCDAEPYPLIP